MPRRAIVTAVFGKHVDLLPHTLGSFARCSGYELHAFVFGEARPQNPDPRITYHTVVEDLQADHVEKWRTPLLLLQTGVLFLMLIGAVNLANLLLARSAAANMSRSRIR